jgi:hypothetical protein
MPATISPGFRKLLQEPAYCQLATLDAGWDAAEHPNLGALFPGSAARKANPSRGGSAKPKGLFGEVAGLPNRVMGMRKS